MTVDSEPHPSEQLRRGTTLPRSRGVNGRPFIILTKLSLCQYAIRYGMDYRDEYPRIGVTLSCDLTSTTRGNRISIRPYTCPFISIRKVNSENLNAEYQNHRGRTKKKFLPSPWMYH